MRTITISFEAPEDYDDVDPELVVEDFFSPQLGFRVIRDEIDDINYLDQSLMKISKDATHA